MMDKLLTIVVPAYNMELYLENTLKSCIVKNKLLQEKYEVLIVNDGSQDRTQKIGEEFQKKHGQIFKLINKENGGYGSVINCGIDNAKGKYFKILDGDDWFNTDELEKLISKLDTINYDMVLMDYTWVSDKTGEKQYWKWSYDIEKELYFDQDKYEDCTDRFWMYGICYKTEILKNNGIKITEHCFYTDMQFVIYPLCFIKSAFYVPVNLYQYRNDREGQSMSYEGTAKHIKDKERMICDLNLYLDNFENRKNKKLIERILEGMYKSYFVSLCVIPCSKEHKQMLIEFLESIKLKYPERYQHIRNKKIKLLELSRYSLYRVCCAWCRKKESYFV